MSKWKELPDWRNQDDYAFLIGMRSEVWAWEFLRRNPEYKKDWHTFEEFKLIHGDGWEEVDFKDVCNGKTAIQSMIDGSWRPRIDKYLAEKWELTNLCDPLKEFNDSVAFKTPTHYPYVVYIQEQFDDLLETYEKPEGVWQQVHTDLALIAVDLTQPVEDQCNLVEKLLREVRKNRIDKGHLAKPEAHSSKPDVWMRHLRVLDARRANPPATYQEIAKVLGGRKNEGVDATKLNDEGDKFITAARKIMKSHKKLLLYKGIPL